MEKKVPKLRFEEFKGDWERKLLGDVSNTYSGGTPLSSKKEFYMGNIPFIKSGEISSDKTEQFITSVALKSSSAKMVSKGDLLFALYGATSGEVALSKIDGAINQAVLAIQTRECPSFLYYYLRRNKAVILNTFLQGGQGNLSAQIIKELNFHFPIQQEQTKIASFLTSVDRKIEMLEKQLELQERYKKGMMQKLFSQEIRFKDENGEEFPEWEEKRLGQLGEFYNGLTGKSGNDFGTGVPFITYKSIFDNSKIDLNRTEKVEITEEDRSKGKQNLVKKGDMFFTVSSETPDEVGMVSVLLDDVGECYLNSFCFGFRINNLEANLPDFFRFYLHSDYFRKATYILAQGSTRYNVSKEGLSRINLVVPCYSEQSAIAIILVSLQNKIESTKKQIEAAKQWKKGLLQKMFV